MQGSFNTHLIALSCIAFVVAAAFLIFDLDDKIYPHRTDGYAASANYSDEPNHILVAEPTPLPPPEPAQKQVSIQEAKPIQKQASKMASEPKSRLPELESKTFSLDISGDAHLGVSSITKKASLSLNLIPIKGTKLQEFEISNARLLLDDSAMPIIGTGAHIDGTKLSLEFLSESIGKFSISGTLDKPILDDTNNKQSITIDDQNFYLAKKDVPYRLEMSGTLSS